MKLDAARSRLAIYTEAEGLFSALAHDLELLAGDLRGEATETSAEIRLSPSAIHVSGVMKRGKLEPGVLSAADRETIDRQVRDEILRGSEVVARGILDAKRAAVDVVTPSGATRITCAVEVTAEGAAGRRARGRGEVSLAALGAPPVKGPLGAFRVKDRVRVEFDLVFG